MNALELCWADLAALVSGSLCVGIGAGYLACVIRDHVKRVRARRWVEQRFVDVGDWK